MRVYARPKAVLLWLVFGFLVAPSAWAGTYAAVVKFAELVAQDDEYVLSAEIHYQLSPRAVEALKNGVPLFWEVGVDVSRQRRFVWNERIAEKKLRFKIQYQALLNVYRVRNEENGEGDSFSSLAAALDALSAIRYVPILKRTALQEGEAYQISVRVFFNRELLPLPLRPFSYINPQWYLSSGWYSWQLKN